jgi:hypothetical protein
VYDVLIGCSNTRGKRNSKNETAANTGGRTLTINDPADTENPNPVIGARPDQENEALRGIRRIK